MVVNAIAIGGALSSFLWVLYVLYFVQPSGHAGIVEHYFTWIQSGEFRVGADFAVDRLTADHAARDHGRRLADPCLLRGIHGARCRVCALLRVPESVHVLHADPGAGREFPADVRRLGRRRASRSYLLIGFWFDRKSATDAGNKAFIVNRIGDFGFSLAMFLIVVTFGTLDFGTVFQAAAGKQPGYAHGDCPVAAGRAPAENRRSFRSMSGCPMPWKAPRRSPR